MLLLVCLFGVFAGCQHVPLLESLSFELFMFCLFCLRVCWLVGFVCWGVCLFLGLLSYVCVCWFVLLFARFCLLVCLLAYVVACFVVY